ncbi:MAG: RHS repeat-associated core domain-containing protein [Anaerolineales bacterium]
MRINSTLYYTLKDHLGSASVITNASGTILGENRYYPFGETRLTTGTIFTDKLFTGQREMAGLGIYHYNARFYSPKLGRFLSPDTIVPGAANPQAYNRYSYVLNNPIRFNDPTGHVACDDTDENGKCINFEQIEQRKITNLRREFKKFKKLPTYSQGEMIPTTFVSVGQYSLVQDLTPNEHALFLREDGELNSWNLLDFGLISRNAIETAKRLFPGQGEGNNPRNAFQHAFWSALLSQRFGSQFAATLTTAHENSAGSKREAQFMDLHNNEVGRSIAEANPYASSAQLRRLVLDTVENGALVVLDNNNIYFSILYRTNKVKNQS